MSTEDLENEEGLGPNDPVEGANLNDPDDSENPGETSNTVEPLPEQASLELCNLVDSGVPMPEARKILGLV
jgi:hypothetical protein